MLPESLRHLFRTWWCKVLDLSGSLVQRFHRASSIALICVSALSAALAGGCSKHTTAPTPTVGVSCGEERWAVKTLSDPDATRVDFANVIGTTVAALNDLTPHCSSLPDQRTFAEEFHVYEVVARVSSTRLEDDHDIHVVLSDPTNSAKTMITEVVDPSCGGATESPFRSLLVDARTTYQTLSPLSGKTVRLQGVGFYDFNHGQTGRSASCIELHPVTRITLVP